MHYVLALSGDLRFSSESHVQFKTSQGKEWKLITLSQINKLRSGDILYLNTHRYFKSRKNGEEWVAVAQNKINFRGRAVTAEQLYERIGKKLPTDTNIKLKIFACYSSGSHFEQDADVLFEEANTFAGQFASIVHKTHPRIWVYGYRDEVKMGATLDFPHQQAGKVLKLTAKDTPLEEPPSARTDSDRASEHRVQFLPNDVSDEDWNRWL